MSICTNLEATVCVSMHFSLLSYVKIRYQTTFALPEHSSDTQRIFLILEMSWVIVEQSSPLNHLVMCQTRSVTGLMPITQKETGFIYVVEVVSKTIHG